MNLLTVFINISTGLLFRVRIFSDILNLLDYAVSQIFNSILRNWQSYVNLAVIQWNQKTQSVANRFYSLRIISEEDVLG